MYLSSNIPKHKFNRCKNIKNVREEGMMFYSFMNMGTYLLLMRLYGVRREV